MDQNNVTGIWVRSTGRKRYLNLGLQTVETMCKDDRRQALGDLEMANAITLSIPSI